MHRKITENKDQCVNGREGCSAPLGKTNDKRKKKIKKIKEVSVSPA